MDVPRKTRAESLLMVQGLGSMPRSTVDSPGVAPNGGLRGFPVATLFVGATRPAQQRIEMS